MRVCVAPEPGVFTAHCGPVRKMRKLSYDHSAAVALAASRAGERCETKRNCARDRLFCGFSLKPKRYLPAKELEDRAERWAEAGAMAERSKKNKPVL